MDDELDIKELFIALWNKKVIIIVVTLICAIFGVIKYKVFTKTESKPVFTKKEESYIAGTSFIIGDREYKVENTSQYVDDNGQIVTLTETENRIEKIGVDDYTIATYNELLKQQDNINLLIKDFNLDIKPEKLAKNISIRKLNGSGVVEIDVKYKDKEMAKQLVNSLTGYFEKTLKNLYQINGITLVDSAKIIEEDEANDIVMQTEDAESGKSPIVKCVIVAFLGFVAVCGVIVVMEIFNSTVKNEGELERATKLKTLAVIPESGDNKDVFRFLRVNISGCKTILVTSPEKSEGKTYVATNLSKAFSYSGKKVLLIDLVQENNSLIKDFSGKGLLDYLSEDEKNIQKCINSSEVANLDVLAIGKDNGNITELLESSKMTKTLEELEKNYDVIVIDSDNILTSANTLAVAKIAKFSLIVVCKRHTKIENAIKAKNNIEDVGGSIVGNVLNKA